MNVTTARNTATPIDAYREATTQSLETARSAWREGRDWAHPLEIWFAYHRTACGLTQRDVARKAEITPAFMSQLVHGYRRHGPTAAKRFAAICNDAVADHPLAIPMQHADIRPDVWD